MIFRDLKPSNVMLTPDNGIKLIDFGIARHFKPGVAMETKPFASIGFAPLEQLGKGQTDQRTDIYAQNYPDIGIILIIPMYLLSRLSDFR